MKLLNEERESLISLGTFIFSLWLLYQTLIIKRGDEEFFESAIALPLIVSIVMLLLSILYLITSFRKSKLLSTKRLFEWVKSWPLDTEIRRIMIAIIFVSAFILLGVAKGRFYLSCMIFMSFILTFYVKRIKPWVSILLSGVFVGLVYVIFSLVFKIPIT